MIFSVLNQKLTTVWFENFVAPLMGGRGVHSELYGNRFRNIELAREEEELESNEIKQISLLDIKAAFGKIIAQGQNINEEDYHRIIFWTQDWVGVIDHNHGQENIYWVPRDPKKDVSHGEMDRSLVCKVWSLPEEEMEKGGDFIAHGLGRWNGDGCTTVFWTKEYVYVTELEYEGETQYFRGFPRNP